jgi:hypothetical protein
VAVGAGFIRRTPVLLHTTVALGLALLVLGFSESAVYAVLDAFGKPGTFVAAGYPLVLLGGRLGGAATEPSGATVPTATDAQIPGSVLPEPLTLVPPVGQVPPAEPGR